MALGFPKWKLASVHFRSHVTRTLVQPIAFSGLGKLFPRGEQMVKRVQPNRGSGGATVDPESIGLCGTNDSDAEAARLSQTILLVEDEDFVREVTTQVLQSAGYRVLKARNAVEAMRVFLQYADGVNLLLTDMVMPGKNGVDLAQELKALCPTLKTILMSGYPSAPNGDTGCDVAYLPKPFSAKSLTSKIRQELAEEDTLHAPMVKPAVGSL